MKPAPRKHVIFLGAGASLTSGYPLGDDLRREWLVSVEGLKNRVVGHPAVQNMPLSVRERIRDDFDRWAGPIREPLELFRKGGFGTIDEFCYMIKDAKADDVVRIKSLLRLVFGLVEPELNFQKSDYYRFIQRLFKPDNLSKLRDDIVVCSFNYDPYYEFLLERAISIRRKALGATNHPPDFSLRGAVTSGFSADHGVLKKLESGSGFCVLKLHGMVAWPNESLNEVHEAIRPHCSFADSLEEDYGKKSRDWSVNVATESRRLCFHGKFLRVLGGFGRKLHLVFKTRLWTTTRHFDLADDWRLTLIFTTFT